MWTLSPNTPTIEGSNLIWGATRSFGVKGQDDALLLKLGENNLSMYFEYASYHKDSPLLYRGTSPIQKLDL